MDCKLSILIPTMPSRDGKRAELIASLLYQMYLFNCISQCEILTDSGIETTGEKRNRLIERANGKYIVFFDDDDEALPNYIQCIISAINIEPDVIPIAGYMTTNGSNKMFWKMGLGFEYRLFNGVYERFPNHIAAMKKELIKDFKFQNITRGEDYDWAKRIHDAGVLKTEIRITEPVYHYKFIQ